VTLDKVLVKTDDIKHTKCTLIHENIFPVQIVYNLFLCYLNVFISLTQTHLFRMYQ